MDDVGARGTRAWRGWRTAGEPRAALVTGAAGGIGRAVAERLLADGLDVLAGRPHGDGLPGTGLVVDLTTREGNRGRSTPRWRRSARLDVVVADAGRPARRARSRSSPRSSWDLLVSLMLTSPFLLARYAWPSLERGDQARFIAIASAHALVASPYKAAYVSAKHGVLGLVKTLALEGAEAGITATAVCPGYVRTPLVEKQIPDQAKAHDISEEEALEQVDPRAARGQAADRARRGRQRGVVPRERGRRRVPPARR